MKIYNTEVWGFKHALRSMRNPMDSWDKADSLGCLECELDCDECPLNDIDNCFEYDVVIGENDMKLAHSLIKSGPEHHKFLRMIHVSADIDMPRYWWSEFDTYHFNTKNSCSTMHRLLNNNRPITKELFVYCEEDLDIVELVVNRIEELRQKFKEIQKTTKDKNEMNRLLLRAKRLLMEGFLQMRTVDTNYAELRTIYFQRVNHRLHEEWVDVFCKWVESLPYAKELILYTGEKENE